MRSFSRLAAFFALALCARATSTGNAWNELSSPGGQFSYGSGDTFTTFSIQPFDVFLNFDDQQVILNPIGTATLPLAPINNPTIAGQLELDIGGIQVFDDLYVMAIPWDGAMDFCLQMDGINLPGELQLEFRYVPVIGQPGDTLPLTLQINPLDMNAPEPSALGLVGLGLLGLGAVKGLRQLVRGRSARDQIRLRERSCVRGSSVARIDRT